MAECNIPNCRRRAPADEAFCAVHRDKVPANADAYRVQKRLHEQVIANRGKWPEHVAEAILAEPQAPSTSAADEGAVREALEAIRDSAACGTAGYGTPAFQARNDYILAVAEKALARLGQHQEGRGGEDADEVLREAYDEGYAEGAGDAKDWGVELGRAIIAWLKARGHIDPPDTAPEWTVQDIIDSLSEHETDLKRSARPAAPAAAQGDAAAESGMPQPLPMPEYRFQEEQGGGGEMLWRNPAPHAAPSSAPTGKFKTFPAPQAGMPSAGEVES